MQEFADFDETVRLRALEGIQEAVTFVGAFVTNTTELTDTIFRESVHASTTLRLCECLSGLVWTLAQQLGRETDQDPWDVLAEFGEGVEQLKWNLDHG